MGMIAMANIRPLRDNAVHRQRHTLKRRKARCSHVSPQSRSGKGFGKQQKHSRTPEDDETAPSDDELDEKESERSDGSKQLAADSLPQVVADRILRRMVSFAGTPALVGIAALPLVRYLKSSGTFDVKAWQVLLFTGSLFVLSLAGVSYGFISASWNPSRVGSLLGWDEARVNLPAFLNRNKQRDR